MSDNIKSIPLEVMNNKIERLCRSKVNFNVKREQFHKLEQGEDETINDFEVMVRAKLQNCEFGKGCKSEECKCKCINCTTNHEEDEIKVLIMCKMKDKETQRELWEIDNNAKDLDNILAHIGGNEAIQLNQAALSNQALPAIR